MGGKKDQGQRTKGNARPSSSIRSAEKLVASGAGALGLLNLGGAQANGYLGLIKPKAAPGTEEVDSYLDGECQMLLKKMTKKDAVTRLKALQEFRIFCNCCDEDCLKGALPYWPRHFNRLSQDVDRRVREVCHTTNATIVACMKRNLAPHLKAMMGNWMISLNDPHGPAACAAQAAFDAAFTPAKQLDALLFCREEILALISENLYQQLSSELVPVDEVELTQNRILATSLATLAMFLERLPVEEHGKLSETYDKLLDNKKFLLFPQHEDPVVRKGWFCVVSAACTALPDSVRRRAGKLCKAVLCHLDGRDPVVVGAMWEAALHLVVSVEDCWTHVSAPKNVMPKIWATLSKGFEGNATIICPYLLPFVSKVPRDKFVSDFQLYEDFFEHCRRGMELREVRMSISEYGALIKAYLEIATIATKESSLRTEGCDDRVTLIVKQLEPVIESGLCENDTKIAVATFNLMGEYLNYVCGTACAQPANPFLSVLQGALWASLELRSSPLVRDAQGATAFSLRRLREFLSRALSPDVKSRGDRRVCFKGSEPATDEPIPTKAAVVTPRPLAGPDSPLTGLAWELCSVALNLFVNNKSTLHLEFLSEMLVPFASDGLFRHLCADKTFSGGEPAGCFFVEVIAGRLAEASDWRAVECLVDMAFSVLESVSHDGQVDVATRLLGVGRSRSLARVLTRLVPRFSAGDECAVQCLRSDEVRRTVVATAVRILLPDIGASDDVEERDAGFGVLRLCLTARPTHRFLSDEAANELLDVVLQYLRRCGQSAASRDDVGRLIEEVFRDATPWCWSLPASQSLLLQYFMLGWQSESPLPRSIWSKGVVSLIGARGDLPVQKGDFFHDACLYVHRILSTEPETDATIVKRLCDAVILLLSVSHRPLQSAYDNLLPLFAIPTVETFISSMLPSDELWSTLTSALWGTLRAGELLVGRLCHPILRAPDAQLQSLAPLAFGTVAARLLVLISAGDNSDCVNRDGSFWRHLDGVLQCVTYCRLAERFVKDFGCTRVESRVAEFGVVLEKQIGILAARLSRSERLSIAKYYHEMALDYGSFSAYTFRELLSILRSSDTEIDVEPSDFLEVGWLEDMQLGGLHVFQLLMRDSDVSNCVMLEEAMRTWSPGDVMREPDALRLAALTECFAALPPPPPSVLSTSEERPVLDSAIDLIMSSVVAWKEQLNGGGPVASTSSATPDCDDGPSDWASLLKVNQVIRLLTALVSRCPRSIALHWDFILVTLGVWTQRIERRERYLETDIALQILACSTFELTAAVAGAIKAFGEEQRDEEAEETTAATPCFPSNLVTEWREFFSAEIYGPLLRVFCRRAESGTPPARHCAFWLEALTVALVWIPPSAVENNSLEAKLVAEWDSGDAVTPVPVKTALNRLCPLVLSPVRDVRLGAYHVLLNCVPLLAGFEELKSAVGETSPDELVQEESSRPLPGALLDALRSAAVAVAATLAGVDLGAVLAVLPEESGGVAFAAVSGYLLTWSLALELFARASPQVRSLLAGHLRDSGMINALAENLFRLLPKSTPFTDRFLLNAQFPPSSREIEELACYVYLKALSHTPALIREWWNSLDKRNAKHVDTFTSCHVSPLLVNRDVRSVQRTDQRQLRNMLVRARPSTREVVATYSVEEISFELVVKLSNNHPLGVVTIETGKRVGVSNSQWSYWLLQLRTFLMNQNGSILDGLELWKQNIDKKFEGIEECYVCYYVLHGTTCQLPRLVCRTCKKKFHSACLYKWFNTSGHSTCPLCRSIF